MLTTIEQYTPVAERAPTFATAEAFAAWLNAQPTAPSDGEWAASEDDAWYGLALWCEQPQDAAHVRDLIGYWCVAEARVGGEWAPDPWPQGLPHVFCFHIDLTKSRHDDVGDGLETLPTYLAEGAPAYKTDRVGPRGTRPVAALPGRVLVAWR